MEFLGWYRHIHFASSSFSFSVVDPEGGTSVIC